MRIKLRNILIFSSIIVILTRCFLVGVDKHDDCRLCFTNNSNTLIHYMIICQNCEDTLTYCGSCYEGNIIAKSTKSVCTNNWDNYFINDQKLNIYYISNDTLQKYGISRIFSERLFLKKIALGSKDADSLNWTIIYP
jgi:hypothetical protein